MNSARAESPASVNRSASTKEPPDATKSRPARIRSQVISGQRRSTRCCRLSNTPETRGKKRLSDSIAPVRTWQESGEPRKGWAATARSRQPRSRHGPPANHFWTTGQCRDIRFVTTGLFSDGCVIVPIVPIVQRVIVCQLRAARSWDATRFWTCLTGCWTIRQSGRCEEIPSWKGLAVGVDVPTLSAERPKLVAKNHLALHRSPAVSPGLDASERRRSRES